MHGLLCPFQRDKHEVCPLDTLLTQENENVFISVHVLLKCSVWIKSWATEQEQTKPSVGPGKLTVPKGRNLTKRKTPEADLEFWSSAFKNMYLLLCVCGWGCHGGKMEVRGQVHKCFSFHLNMASGIKPVARPAEPSCPLQQSALL